MALAAHAQPDTTHALAGQIELARLVDLAAHRLHLVIDYDAAALKGTITLRQANGVSDAELWDLTNRLLAARGFTTVRMPRSDAVSVVKIGEAANLSRVAGVVDVPAPEGPPAGFTSVALRVRHRPVREVIETVGRLLSKPGGSISALSEPGGLVLISDLTPRVELATALIERLDVSIGESGLEVVPARNMTAAALVTLVAQVAAKRELVSGEKVPGEVLPGGVGDTVLVIAPPDHAQYWKSLIAQLDQREEVTTVVYTPRNFGAAEVAALIEQAVHTGPREPATGDGWRLVVDQLTGTLIVTATPSEHAEVAALLARLDAAPQASRRPVRSFAVRNRNVTDLLPVLNDLMQAGVLEAVAPPETGDITAARVPPELHTPPPPVLPGPAGPSTTASAPRPEPGGRTAVQPGGAAPLALSADEATNTLIAMGEPRLLEQLQVLITQLDVRQPQVMLEVMLISLTESQALSLGIELEKVSLDADLSYRLSSLFGLSGRAGGVPIAGGAGLTGVVLNPGDFSVVLRALQTVQGGRSLSMPRILVGNNQSASLDSVLEQPFTSTNSGNTVATTSFGGSLPAGTQVSITPQIAEGGHLTLRYQVSLSSFTGASSGPGVPPPRQQNRVQSVATIPDGFTVVVGGIDLETSGKSVSQVPLLGNIPIIGEAFKNRNRNSSHQKFYVFIRAGVLRAGGFEDLKYLSGVATSRLGVDDGFPRLEPRVIK
ncbi:MAG: hypothetical protein IT437_07480 [Phycisphaerales bacterium]|nr:hypothetical protein [Phycisphaerales bacterium]